MLLKQYYLGCLAHASYLIADEDTRTAVVVDPQRDIDQYLDDAADYNLQIRYVFLTHFHADFLAGHLELRDRVSAAICLGSRAQADFPFTPYHDGQRLEFGTVRIETLETPGHTPESICLLVYDLEKDPSAPHAVLTGDTLFIGDVGRPDLMASIGLTAEELAGMLYDSLRQKLLPLPDATLVYPAHGAGSACGKNLSRETFASLGNQKQFNYALQPMSKAAFIALVTAGQSEPPAYFPYDAVLNRRERATLSQTLARVLNPLSFDDVLRQMNAGAQVLDARDPSDFAHQHLAGSVNVGLGGPYATWAGSVLDQEAPIIVIADVGREEEAAMRLGRIGFDHIAGYLDGGPEALGARPDLMRQFTRLTPEQLAAHLSSSEPPVVLDVRGPGERQNTYIAGSLHISLNRLKQHMHQVPLDRRVVVYCAGGYRSSIAVSLLEQHGLTSLSDLAGGMAAWETAGMDVVVPAAVGK
ncbi:Hydroxyacylglutathione hydrolase [Candidatus Entotheonellaceae bacterium PAL068K]